MDESFKSKMKRYLKTKILGRLNTWKSVFLTSLTAIKNRLVETEKKW